jgi:hypothetical protein
LTIAHAGILGEPQEKDVGLIQESFFIL